ncbi:hypothetical protein BV898_15411 [Hypsibius exemplaris]|uniref:Gustatory receptor n=1 Tax=Hypsibius exemplaris TaxID=2072580 RepID=A0A9X6NAY8_HYPEX|nr:hypothetical protein BV898_15411 [Hypsibius exemplaris]
MDLHFAVDLSRQDNQPPSYMPRWLTTVGLLPTSNIFATDQKGRIKKVTLYTFLHVTYWTLCCLFIAIAATSNAHLMIMAIVVPVTNNPLLEALMEGSFTFEAYRGAIFCVFIVTNCKSGIKSIVRQTEQLIVTFSLTDANVRSIRRCTAALLSLTVISVTTIVGLQSLRWILRKTMKLDPFFAAPSSIMVPLFVLFTSVPELLSRIAVLLVASSGMVLLLCLKVTRRTVFDSEHHTDNVRSLHTALYQYYALASSLAAISKHLGGVLAFSILSDLLPLCGRITRLLFEPQARSEDEAVIDRLADTCKFRSQLLEYKRRIFPQHPEVPNDQTKNGESFERLCGLIQELEDQPLALSLLHGFQVGENFYLVIATVLSSYAIICYQFLKETSSALSKSASPNCTFI